MPLTQKNSLPLTIFLAISALMLGLIPFAHAGEDNVACTPHNQYHSAQKIPAHYKALNLNTVQQEKLRAISAAHQEVLHKNMQLMRANRLAEQKLVESPDFDEVRAQQLAAQDAKIMGDNNLATLRFRHEVYQVLTPEQRMKFDGMRSQNQESRSKARLPAP